MPLDDTGWGRETHIAPPPPPPTNPTGRRWEDGNHDYAAAFACMALWTVAYVKLPPSMRSLDVSMGTQIIGSTLAALWIGKSEEWRAASLLCKVAKASVMALIPSVAAGIISLQVNAKIPDLRPRFFDNTEMRSREAHCPPLPSFYCLAR